MSLVLSRNPDEGVTLSDASTGAIIAEFRIVSSRPGGQVRIAIDAGPEVSIERNELRARRVAASAGAEREGTA